MVSFLCCVIGMSEKEALTIIQAMDGCVYVYIDGCKGIKITK